MKKRIIDLKRDAINEANKRVLGVIKEDEKVSSSQLKQQIKSTSLETGS